MKDMLFSVFFIITCSHIVFIFKIGLLFTVIIDYFSFFNVLPRHPNPNKRPSHGFSS